MKLGVELIVLVFIYRQAVIYSRSTHFTLLLNASVFNSFRSIRVCVVVVFLSESEGTLILPRVESFHKTQDDDATTVTSDDSFFSAAEVSSCPLLCED